MNGFMIACRKGFAEIVSLFLKEAAAMKLEVNAKDKKKGRSGLTLAVLEGHLEIVKLLTSTAMGMTRFTLVNWTLFRNNKTHWAL